MSLLMRLSEVREVGQVVPMRAHHVGRHGTVADQGQFDVDDIVRQLAAVEEPRGV